MEPEKYAIFGQRVYLAFVLSISTIQSSLESDRSKQNIVRLVEAMSGQGFDWSRFCLAMSHSTEQKIAWKMGWLLTHYIERHPADGSKHQFLVWTF